MAKLVPCPRVVAISMRPPIAVISFRTTSMPTPRPASSVTASAVDRPEAKMSWASCASVGSPSAGRQRPSRRPSCAASRGRGRRRRRDSTSAISLLSWRSADADLAGVGLARGDARPRATRGRAPAALRSMCSSGAPMRSSTLRSSSTSAPSIVQLGLLVELARGLAHDAVQALVQVGERHRAHAHQLLLHVAADARLVQQRRVGVADVLEQRLLDRGRRRSGPPPSCASAPAGACSGRTRAGRTRGRFSSGHRQARLHLAVGLHLDLAQLAAQAGDAVVQVGERLLDARAAPPRRASARSPPRPTR